jgi:hypothetical protein
VLNRGFLEISDNSSTSLNFICAAIATTRLTRTRLCARL